MGKVVISGIQQIGIGNADVKTLWRWYKKYFGFDVRVFEDAAVANYMLPYTGGEPRERYAALSLNLQGGGGFEIWQYTQRTPAAPKNPVMLGDLGIYACKLRTHDALATYTWYKKENLNLLTQPKTDPRGSQHFYVADPNGNVFDIIEDKKPWFKNEKKMTGGTFGATIGCTDLEKSIAYYGEILGYDQVLWKGEKETTDFTGLALRGTKYKRAILTHSKPRSGAFSRMFGHSEIELVQVTDATPFKMFEGRFWGDLGFIHLCFDISGMDALRELCASRGYAFTVDSSAAQQGQSFDMGEAAGFFSYIEDPDGTLIEFVETHKVPVLKKLGIYLNLKKRNAENPLPDAVIKALGLNRFND